MNLILLFPEDDLPDGRVQLTGRRLHHVRRIHRAAVGDELSVGRLGGRIGTGRVVELDRARAVLDVELEREPPAPLPVTLALALPRPRFLRRVLIAATAMGVKRVALFDALRVERSYWESRDVSQDALRASLLLGLEQASDTRLPELSLHRRFGPFVQDDLPLLAKDTLRLVAHPAACEPCPRAVGDPITLVVGPEGGLLDDEVARFEAHGFLPVALGDRVLRVETAVPVLLSRLCL